MVHQWLEGACSVSVISLCDGREQERTQKCQCRGRFLRCLGALPGVSPAQWSISIATEGRSGTHIALVRKVLEFFAHDVCENVFVPYQRQLGDQRIPPWSRRNVMIVTSTCLAPASSETHGDLQVYPLRLDIHERTPNGKVRVIWKLVSLAVIPLRLLEPVHVVNDVWHDMSRTRRRHRGGVY